MALLRRKRVRLRPLTETEAYARCHGDRAEDVKVVAMERKKRPRFETTVSGEQLRSLFEERLDSREVEPEAGEETEATVTDLDAVIAEPEAEAVPERAAGAEADV
jgi:hypothetical protein